MKHDLIPPSFRVPLSVDMIELRTEDVSSAKRNTTAAQFFRFDQPERGTDFRCSRAPGCLFRLFLDDYFLQAGPFPAGARGRPPVPAGFPQGEWPGGRHGGERAVPARAAGLRLRFRL